MAFTKKQKKFIASMASGFNAGDAAIKAGYNDKSYGYHLKKNDNIKKALITAMEKAGINDDTIAVKIKEGMEAMTVPKSPEETRRFEDHFVRKQFLDMAIKIRGDFAPEKIESTHREIKLIIDNDLIKALQDSKAIDIIDGELVEDAECEQLEENNETKQGLYMEGFVPEAGCARDIEETKDQGGPKEQAG